MFKNPFSFHGRIRRTEYGISLIIYVVASVIINLIIEGSDGEAAFVVVAYIPLLWFLWAQGAKRCHDVGNSGWYQIIPFYGFWLLFQDGEFNLNKYGENPKSNRNNVGYCTSSAPTPPHNDIGGTYQGGYDGGHNNPNANNTTHSRNLSNTENISSGYKDGNLYN